MLFRSSCPSPNPSYPFWLLALTFRSSRPAYGGRLASPVGRHFIPRCRRPRFRHRIGAAAICPFQTAARRHAGVTAAARSAGATVLVVAGAPAPPFLACAVERVIPVDFHFSILMSRKAAIHFRQCLTASSYGINAYRPSCLLAKHRRTPASAIAILFMSFLPALLGLR